MNRKVFVIDEARCTGCHACSIACKDRADLPDEVDWLRVEERVHLRQGYGGHQPSVASAKEGETGTFPGTAISFRVTHCFHCDEPPCVEACPPRAIAKIEGGFVALDAAECTGCGECVAACPFGAVVMLPEGTASKCDGCAGEVAGGRSPACVRACPMGALDYAPVEDVRTDGRVSDPAFEDHGARPAVLYLCGNHASTNGT